MTMHDTELLTLLGFETEKNNSGYTSLMRNDEVFLANLIDAPSAWLKAPTIETLMPKLIESMRRIEFAEICISFADNGRYDLVLFNSGDAIYAVENTLAEAVAELFKSACEDGLIKPKTVVLS